MIRAVLFDLGHTLMDFAPTEDALWTAYARIRDRLTAWAHDRTAPETADLIEGVARAIDTMVVRSYDERRLEELDQIQMFDDAFRTLGYELPRPMLAELAEIDHDAISASWTVADSTLSALGSLKSRYSLGLVSNFSLLPHRLHGDLERLGIRKHLDAIAFSCEVGVRKPDPRIFLHALDTLGVHPSEAVHVGDRVADDVAGANALGVRTILTHEFRVEPANVPSMVSPDAVVSSLSEVPAIIARWE